MVLSKKYENQCYNFNHKKVYRIMAKLGLKQFKRKMD